MMDEVTSDTQCRVSYCAACGEVVNLTEWHPVMASRTSDDETEIRSFCSESCHDRWVERNRTE